MQKAKERGRERREEGKEEARSRGVEPNYFGGEKEKRGEGAK